MHKPKYSLPGQNRGILNCSVIMLTWISLLSESFHVNKLQLLTAEGALVIRLATFYS